MKTSKIILAFLVGTLAISGVRAFAQANITTTPTAFIYVDAVNGSDANPGTQQLPFKTISASVKVVEANNNNSIGTAVYINPGIYRETVTVQGNWKQTAAPMTFQAVTSGTAIVAGSDVLTNWVPEGANPSIYDTAWNYTLTGCPVPAGWPSNFAPITLRTEMIFINGNPIAEVMSYAAMIPGTFFIDAPNHLIHVWPASQVNMSTATVESAARRQTWIMNALSNVIVRGLVFRHGSSCMNQPSLSIGGSTNVLLDTVQALWNNWVGMAISSSSQITVQNSIGSHNGGVGFLGTQNLSILYTGNETDANNWRGAMGAFYDWGMGGTKFFTTQGATITNQISYNNQAQGLWFDTDHKNVTVSNATLSGNLMGAVQVEANPGPISITNSLMCSNGAGINLIYSTGLSLTNNIFYNNGGTNSWQGEIFMAGSPGGRTITDWVTGQQYTLFSGSMTFTGNTSQDASPGQNTFGTYFSLGTDWTDFTSTFVSDNNTYYDPLTTTSFKIPGSKYNAPTNLAGFQTLMGQDAHSVWANNTSLASQCVVPTPSFTDFSATTNLMVYQMVSGANSGTVGAVIHVNSYGYGQVTLAVGPLPAGVTASFDTKSMISGVANLTFTAQPSATTQSVPVTIFATSGARVHPITITLNVVG